ncbi:hypothetical protein ACN38_g11890 [Penicillium nordicum]|uniref:Uncharacterized protein n=1 Tax=Penicillium nordicum TaxID=229535 RepID=A0A0M8NU43_9EURO|nr:hypothetical protein ACN38_g11890 [Penicillium nordicum]
MKISGIQQYELNTLFYSVAFSCFAKKKKRKYVQGPPFPTCFPTKNKRGDAARTPRLHRAIRRGIKLLIHSVESIARHYCWDRCHLTLCDRTVVSSPGSNYPLHDCVEAYAHP